MRSRVADVLRKRACPRIAALGALLIAGCAATAPTRHPGLRYRLAHVQTVDGIHTLVLVPKRALHYSFDVEADSLGMSPAAKVIAHADFLRAAQRYCAAGTAVLDGPLAMPWGSRSSDRIDDGRIVSAGSLSGLLEISGRFRCR